VITDEEMYEKERGAKPREDDMTTDQEAYASWHTMEMQGALRKIRSEVWDEKAVAEKVLVTKDIKPLFGSQKT
jgi:hypothetical protein